MEDAAVSSLVEFAVASTFALAMPDLQVAGSVAPIVVILFVVGNISPFMPLLKEPA